MVIRDGVLVIAAGIVAGLAVAVVASRILTSLLYDVQPRDPITLMAMALLFAVVSIAAMLIPMRRATRVDAIVALRQE
jgi:putative ABC transport system permease protein